MITSHGSYTTRTSSSSWGTSQAPAQQLRAALAFQSHVCCLVQVCWLGSWVLLSQPSARCMSHKASKERRFESLGPCFLSAATQAPNPKCLQVQCSAVQWGGSGLLCLAEVYPAGETGNSKIPTLGWLPFLPLRGEISSGQRLEASEERSAVAGELGAFLF